MPVLEWIGEQAEGAWNTVSGAGAAIWHKMISFVHGVVHGVTGWLVGLFGVVEWAWNRLVGAATSLWGGLKEIAEEVAGWIVTFVTHTLPLIWAKIEHAVSQAWKWVENAVDYAADHIAHLAAQAWKWVENALRWVKRHVFDPIWSWIKTIGREIMGWAHKAWYLVTHPIKLAELLFWPMFSFFEHVAWTVAKKIAKWLAEIVLHQMVKLVHLVEEIVADVL